MRIRDIIRCLGFNYRIVDLMELPSVGSPLPVCTFFSLTTTLTIESPY
jgi:hypothetical protein